MGLSLNNDLLLQRTTLKSEIDNATKELNEAVHEEVLQKEKIDGIITKLHSKANELFLINEKICTHVAPSMCRRAIKYLSSKEGLLTTSVASFWIANIVCTGLQEPFSKSVFVTAVGYGGAQCVLWYTDRNQSEIYQKQLQTEIRNAGEEYFKKFLDVFVAMKNGFEKDKLPSLLENHERISYPIKAKIGCPELWISLSIDLCANADQPHPLKRTKSRLFEKALQTTPKTPTDQPPSNVIRAVRSRGGSFDFAETYKGLVEECGVDVRFFVENGNCFDQTGNVWKYGSTPSNSKAESRSSIRPKTPSSEEKKGEEQPQPAAVPEEAEVIV